MMVRCMFQKGANPRRRGGRRAANTQPRINLLEIERRVIVQFEVAFLSRDAAPKINIRFVPYFEVPLRNFVDAVSIDKVLREMSHQAIPLLHAFWWRHIWLIPEWMQRIWVKCELLWHKAHFHDWAYSIL